MVALIDSPCASDMAMLLIEHDMDAVFKPGRPHHCAGVWQGADQRRRRRHSQRHAEVQAVYLGTEELETATE
jgi:ABC-type branched-subunit amino acid transport system ATPase component